MAISSPRLSNSSGTAVDNIRDNATFYAAVSNKTSDSSLVFVFKCRGTTFATRTVDTAIATVTLTSGERGALWDLAGNGTSLSGIITVTVDEWIGGSYNNTAGTSSAVALRIYTSFTNLNVTTANPYNLDSPTNISMSWTNPDTDHFKGKLYVKVNGVTCVTNFWFNSAPNFSLNETQLGLMLDAMGGVSPGSIQFIVETHFVMASSTYLKSYTTDLQATRATGIIKGFVGHVWLKVSGVMQKYEVWLKDTTFKRHHAYVKDTTFKESK